MSFFFSKVTALRPVTLLKKGLRHWSFPANFAKCLRTPIFVEHFPWLLLTIWVKKYYWKILFQVKPLKLLKKGSRKLQILAPQKPSQNLFFLCRLFLLAIKVRLYY